ncbi:MAG TPA: hypothetical protein VN963_02040 [bacterium]|nr:hypothetical protein [bacterium]
MLFDTAPHSKMSLLENYQTLNELWDRGLFPSDLELHYFLHWFTHYRGNVTQTAKGLRIHRGNMQGRFRQFGLTDKTSGLRHSWQRLTEQNREASFESNFYSFYGRFNGETKFTPEENGRLIALWQSKFPLKTLLAHYALWVVRTHKPKDWFEKKLDYTARHHFRLLKDLLNSKIRDGFWLAPLKPNPDEIYSRRRGNTA